MPPACESQAQVLLVLWSTAGTRRLGAWARERGGHSCLLQVAGSNAPAFALYERLGFTEHHRYHYRLGPPPVR